MKILYISALIMLTACAKTPSEIVAVSMEGAYDNVTCSKASALLKIEKNTLVTLSVSQNAAVNGDALGVFLIGIPTSSLSGGDQEGAIAASKGKILALESRLQSC